MDTTISTRIGTQPVSAGRSPAPSPAQASAQTPAALPLPQYFNPSIQVDPNSGLAVLVERNAQTGEVVSQIPTEQAIQEYRRHMTEAPSSPHQAARQVAGSAAAAAPTGISIASDVTPEAGPASSPAGLASTAKTTSER